MKLCFATNNIHKLEEVINIVGSSLEIISLNDIHCLEDLPETRDTIPGNASQKANYVWDNYHTPCFADDTGLEVESLGGAPGVYSARYAGPQRNSDDNMKALLKNMGAATNRRAQFRTVIALRLPNDEFEFEGIVKGTILHARRGSGGFGYDPLFLPDGCTKTLAEMSMEEKNLISHRALAVKKLGEFLKMNFSDQLK